MRTVKAMMKMRTPAGLRDECGSTLVEMAIVLPIFVLLMVGLMELSITLYNYCNAASAVRAAGRYASLHSCTSGNPATQAQINSIVTGNLHLAGANAPAVLLDYGDRTSGTCNGNYVGDLVGVGIVWSSPGILPWKGSFYLSSEAYRVISR